MKRTIAAIALLLATAAHAQTFGLHLVSVHVPARAQQNNVNPGIYVMTENGFTAGVYRNTLNRISVYAGITAEAGPFAITLGASTGYQRRRITVDCGDRKLINCWEEEGSSNAFLQPFLSPSVRLPEVFGATPRLSYIPGIGNSTSVLHLSVERRF